MRTPSPAAAAHRRACPARHGAVLLYGMCALIVMVAFASLAVEYGRVQVAANQLQAATDAAARYAANGVKHDIGGVNAAVAMARASLRENSVNGRNLTDDQSTVEVGQWNSGSHKFTATTDMTKINAVRVTVTCGAATNTQVATPFASLIGKNGQGLTATATALYDADGSASYAQLDVPATSNPWLAGSSTGTSANVGNPHANPDYAGSSSAPKQSPVKAAGLTLAAGSSLTFDGVNGGANNTASTVRYDGDGNTGSIVSNFKGDENGKSDLTAPINSVVAVFLTNTTPSGTTGLPPALDFSTVASRDFTTLKPQLNQPFFIGDGRRDNGDLQRFIVPAGATRLYVGTMDGYEWNNNVGGFTVTATSAAKVTLVK